MVEAKNPLHLFVERPAAFGAFAASTAGCRGVGFGVDRNHAGGCGGRNAGHAGPRIQQREPRVLLSNAACGRQQREGDRVGAERVELACGGLIPARRVTHMNSFRMTVSFTAPASRQTARAILRISRRPVASAASIRS